MADEVKKTILRFKVGDHVIDATYDPSTGESKEAFKDRFLKELREKQRQSKTEISGSGMNVTVEASTVSGSPVGDSVKDDNKEAKVAESSEVSGADAQKAAEKASNEAQSALKEEVKTAVDNISREDIEKIQKEIQEDSSKAKEQEIQQEKNEAEKNKNAENEQRATEKEIEKVVAGNDKGPEKEGKSNDGKSDSKSDEKKKKVKVARTIAEKSGINLEAVAAKRKGVKAIEQTNKKTKGKEKADKPKNIDRKSYIPANKLMEAKGGRHQ